MGLRAFVHPDMTIDALFDVPLLLIPESIGFSRHSSS